MTAPVIIIGAGGHARVLISSLKALRREIIGILHPDVTLIGQTIDGIPVIGNDDKVWEYSPEWEEKFNQIQGKLSQMSRIKI